jgi:1-acyl-sn-glycerol-3-phosphate acyltransferase
VTGRMPGGGFPGRRRRDRPAPEATEPVPADAADDDDTAFVESILAEALAASGSRVEDPAYDTDAAPGDDVQPGDNPAPSSDDRHGILHTTTGSAVAAAEYVRDRFTSPFHAATRFVAQRGVLKPAIWSMTTVTVLGRERLADISGGFVVVANHSSHLDAPLIVGALPRSMARYLATGAAADYFFDVWWRRGLTRLFFNAFPVQRTGSKERTVSAKSLLLRGLPILVFPEGTRSKDGTMGPFKPGAAALAASCDVPCVPLALIGANIAHPRGANWPRPGRLPVGVVFGDPMRPEPGENAIDFTERIRQEILHLKEIHTPGILGRNPPPEGAHS